MIETIATIDIINHALYKIEENKVEKAKEILVNYKNKLQSEVWVWQVGRGSIKHRHQHTTTKW